MTWRTVVGTLATFVTTIVVAFWLINEPARMKEAEDGFAGRSMEAGAAIYENNCTRCHGPAGGGLVGLAPAIYNPALFDGSRLAEVGWRTASTRSSTRCHSVRVKLGKGI